MSKIHPGIFVLIATLFEVTGDALIRTCIYQYTGVSRIIFFVIGAALLFFYGFSLNLAPVEFKQVVGLYIATLFVVWQVGNYIVFRTGPTIPVLVGGMLIVAGVWLLLFGKKPQGMVLIPSANNYTFKTDGVMIEGNSLPDAVGVQYPWQTHPQRSQKHVMNIAAFYMDEYPVTNKQYKQFVDATHYHPNDDYNFLKVGKMQLIQTVGMINR